MSGTSLDGIDIAITTISDSGHFNLLTAQTFPFPDNLQCKLSSLINNPITHIQDLGHIDIALGRSIAHSINKLLNESGITSDDVAAIGSHGQTLFHSPSGENPFSLQIGDANSIAELTGITTVADFRQRDIAAGGQGAPLVPAFHHALFSSSQEDRVIVNIGGISNITSLPSSSNNPVIGFDTGPGNVLLDHWIQQHQNKSYDEGGQWAASGKLNQQLLSLLLNDSYFEQPIPKSTGRELFNQDWLKTKLDDYGKYIAAEDVQATLSELTASTIANDIKLYANSSNSVFICGGGAHNAYLLKRLQYLLDSKTVTTTQTLNLHPDWVEASAFAWLAFRTINKQAGNLPSVTGAKHPVILGSIYPA